MDRNRILNAGMSIVFLLCLAKVSSTVLEERKRSNAEKLETERKKERAAWNSKMLSQCSPEFASRASGLLGDLESLGLRPRIRETWRSLAAQQAAVANRTSEVSEGRHSETSMTGDHRSSAMDLFPLSRIGFSNERALLLLACFARKRGLETGLEWGLSPEFSKKLDGLISNCSEAAPDTPIGWDPWHVQLVRQCAVKAPPELYARGGKTTNHGSSEREGLPNGRPAIEIFCDLDCVYCHRLFQWLATTSHARATQSVEVRIHLLVGHEQQAYAEKFACLQASQRVELSDIKELTSDGSTLKVKRLSGAARRCLRTQAGQNIVMADRALAERFSIAAVPELFVDGARWKGVRDFDELRAFLNEFD